MLNASNSTSLYFMKDKSRYVYIYISLHMSNMLPNSTLTPGILLRGDEVLAELGVVLNLGYHLVVYFHVKVRANVAGDEELRR